MTDGNGARTRIEVPIQLLDQFACSAPPAPEWFMPRVPPAPEHPVTVHTVCFREAPLEEVEAARLTLVGDSNECREWRLKLERWRAFVETQRAIQWPYAWAKFQAEQRILLVQGPPPTPRTAQPVDPTP